MQLAGMTKQFSPFRLALMLLSSIVILFIVAPLVGMVVHTPFKDIAATANESQVLHSIWLSISISAIATVFFAIPAIPLSYLLARYDFPLKGLINGLVDLPVVIPHSVAGIALIGIISGDSIIGNAMSVLGVNLIGTPVAIAVAMAFVSLPFLVNAARDGFLQVPVKLEQAALTLGASPFKVFYTISLPLAFRNILTGFVMMFARGLSEFGAVVIVAYHPMVASVMIYDRFTTFGLKYARPAAIVFLSISLFVFVFLRLLSRKR
ncbi:ABC transporter permease [Tenuifilum thalassicum]|uniref:ABC transporter permease subunit n=1 Tax=Tenuifilum thalassicum TaxID=2590900 RepID=A0A7D3XF57_9BACT|nr:ABC transporter permease [Tenuifilum thalassicum]QKG80527.1 ABC transporter permease subunit [Tenuifilum thalassicum]